MTFPILSNIQLGNKRSLNHLICKYVCSSQVLNGFHPSKVLQILLLYVQGRRYLHVPTFKILIYTSYIQTWTPISMDLHTKKEVNKCHIVGSWWPFVALTCLYVFMKKLNHDVYVHMGVSKNRGTPKSSILIGISIINRPFWGTTIFGNTHILSATPWLYTAHKPHVHKYLINECIMM